jgi:Periplasmic serine proteases (ClpP class)
MKYPHLAARVFNTPLLIHPAKLDAIIAGLGPRLLGVDALATDAAAQGADLFSTRRGTRAKRGYGITDGVAVIGASGALVHRTRIDADSTRLLGYNDIAADVEDALANPEVHALALVWDSPGGEAQGAFELADRLHALRGRKPMVSIVDGMAASAAYLAASAADEVVSTATGYAGSIGVVMRHVDFSHALHADGVKVTHIFAGAHKVDGNPFEPLPDTVRADFQAEVNDLYDLFITAVARQRGIAAEAVRKTQAQTYRGLAAKAVGLVDRLGTTDQVIADLAAQRNRSFPAGAASAPSATAQDLGASMSGNTPAGGQQAATPQPAAADLAQARAEGHAEGAQAERERTAAILAHQRAATHVALAHQCITSGLSADQAGAILAAAPEVAVLSVANDSAAPFHAAMAAIGNPDVSGIERDTSADSDEAALAAQIVQTFRAHAKA